MSIAKLARGARMPGLSFFSDSHPSLSADSHPKPHMRLRLLLACLWLCGSACIQATAPDPVLLWNTTFTSEMRRDTLAPPIMARTSFIESAPPVSSEICVAS